MMFIRGVVACTIFTLSAIALVAAAEQPRLPPGVTCALVREKVAEHGKVVAYAWAKINGYSRNQIAQAHKCLRS